MKTNWQTKTLGEIGNIFSGNSINEKVKKTKYLNLKEGIPYVATKDVSYENEINYENGVKIPEKDLDKFRIAHKNSVFICAEGGSAGRKLAFNIKDVCFVNKLFAFEAKEIIEPKFIYYFYQSDDFQKQFKLKMTGLIGGVSMSKFKDINVPYPNSLETQKQIVKILDEVFESIFKSKENTEKNLKNAKELFESYLEEIFSNSKEDWEEKKLGDYYDVRDGTHDSPKYQKTGFPLVTSKNLKEGKLDFQKISFITKEDYDKINARSNVDKGDVLFAMIGTIGNPVVVKEEPNFAIKNVALFKVSKNQDSDFLKYILDSKSVINKMLSESKGTTQKFVGLGYLRNFKIKIPTIQEQKTIVQKLDLLSKEIKELESIYKQKVKDLEELKKSMLQKAFSGELTNK